MSGNSSERISHLIGKSAARGGDANRLIEETLMHKMQANHAGDAPTFSFVNKEMGSGNNWLLSIPSFTYALLEQLLQQADADFFGEAWRHKISLGSGMREKSYDCNLLPGYQKHARVLDGIDAGVATVELSSPSSGNYLVTWIDQERQYVVGNERNKQIGGVIRAFNAGDRY